MGKVDQKYRPGDRLIECDICGLTYRFRDVRKGTFGNQKGLVVCYKCYEIKHPNYDPVPIRTEGELEELK